MLTDEAKVERHACLTPIWSETAWFADYVLPMGHASERHDLMSQETHAARWIGFRQPVLRVALRAAGPRRFDSRGRRTRRRARPGVGGGRVLDRAVVAHRSRRQPRHPQVLRVALPPRREAPHRGAATAGSSRTPCPACPRPRRRRGSRRSSTCASTARFLIEDNVYGTHEQAPLAPKDLEGATVDPVTRLVKQGGAGGRRRDRRRRASRAFPRPRASSSSSRRR